MSTPDVSWAPSLKVSGYATRTPHESCGVQLFVFDFLVPETLRNRFACFRSNRTSNSVHNAENRKHDDHADYPPDDVVFPLLSSRLASSFSDEINNPPEKDDECQTEQEKNKGLKDDPPNLRKERLNGLHERS